MLACRRAKNRANYQQRPKAEAFPVDHTEYGNLKRLLIRLLLTTFIY